MEAQEEVIGYSKHQTHMIMIKRKQTKRPRPSSPLALTMASTTYSTITEDGSTSGVSDDSGGFFHLATSSSSPENSNIEFTKIIQQEDEEDMANCLILLAQGQQSVKRNKGELYLYECKTCNRGFPSFQALGGHRASHKKPKPTIADEKKVPLTTFPKIESGISNISNNHPIILSLQINPNKALCTTTTTTTKNSKIHECSICGTEFTSGQALGGHMRRHRAMPPPVAISTTIAAISNECQEVKKSRTLLSLDLNLPAPDQDNDHQESRFPYGLKDKLIVFSSPSLVDCHF